MQAGDIVFLKPTSVIGKLVTWVDGGEYSHVAIAVSPTHIIEAQYFTRSRIWPVYTGDNVMVLDLDLEDWQRQRIIDNAIEMTGIWYDYKTIASYFIRHIFKWNTKAIWNSQNNLICSELVMALLISAEYYGAGTETNITPRELFEKLIAYQLDSAA